MKKITTRLNQITETVSRINISDQWDHRTSRDIPFLERTLNEGFSGTSAIVKEYEESICEYYRLNHCIAVSSGSTAVAASLSGVDWDPGDEVILPPTAPICSVLPMIDLGLVPVFCDVNPNNLGLCHSDLENCISERTCAIFEIPMWGYPARVDITSKFAQRNNIPLILDLAHCHLTKLNGLYLCEYGDISCFSTHHCKFLSTGEGGFVLTESAQRAQHIRSFSRFGNLDGENFGINLKLGGLQAALGLARWKSLDDKLATRLSNREYILDHLDNPYFRELEIVAGGQPNGYALLLTSINHDGRELVNYQSGRGIPSDIKKYDNRPLYEYQILRKYKRPCHNAKALLRSLTTIPLHPNLDKQALDYIIATLNEYRREK